MSKNITRPESSGHTLSISKKRYKDTLRKLQVELVKLQRHFIECNDKILIILFSGSARNPCPGWKNEASCIPPTNEATRSA